MTATVDCVALKAQYDELQASFIKFLTGKRVASNQYMDMTTSFSQVDINAVKNERDTLAARLKVCCGMDVEGAAPRMLTPAISNGRCAR